MPRPTLRRPDHIDSITSPAGVISSRFVQRKRVMTALKYPSSFPNILTDRPNWRKYGIPGRGCRTGGADWLDSHVKMREVALF